ncbi:MAG TPA: hypothetical protein VEJ36_05200 [Nitrososphaerales archaeon]|nr:hypothetical protein [Nitrososphaerales archaeon]
MYEVKVTVSTLDDASKLIRSLSELGYSKVSMSQPSSPLGSPPAELLDRARASLNRLNDWILRSLDTLEAADRIHGVTAEKIVATLRKMPETNAMFNARGEGIVSRTVSMVASSVLGDKFGWVSCDKSHPRRFWLTPNGLQRVQSLKGESTE